MDRYEEALERAKAGKPMDEVFPELKESEDERIRKWLIELVKSTDTNHSNMKLSENCKLALAYLEKQKEQKPNIELIQRSWYMEGYHDREFFREPKWIIKTGKGGPKYEKNEKYGQPLEQKHELCDMGRWDEESYNNGIHHVLHNPEAYGLTKQKPAEWSEEDERAIDRACVALRAYSNGDLPEFLPSELLDYADRLQSLRPRLSDEEIKKIRSEEYTKGFNDAAFGSKQEWSEEDEAMLENVLGTYKTLEDMLDLSTSQDRDILESMNFERGWLKDRFKSPQPQWKPSEEQMAALNGAWTNFDSTNAILKTLYNDLKKLM